MSERTIRLALLFLSNLALMALVMWAAVELGARTGYRAGHEVVYASTITFVGISASYAALCLLNRSRWSMFFEIVSVVAMVTLVAHWCFAWWINAGFEAL